jgi:hypothetical protein
MRRTLFLSILIFGVLAVPASASAASVSISDFSNAGPGQMKAAVSAALGDPCPAGSNCLGGALQGVVRPVGSACQSPKDPNDAYYYNTVFTEHMDTNGTIDKTYTFSPGTYKDTLGVHPIPEGPIQLCAFVSAAWMFGGDVFGGTYATTVGQGYYGVNSPGSGAAGATGQRVAAIKKCKKKFPKGPKRQKCIKKAKKLQV